MTPEWFYLNDISWYIAADGRIVAPVSGVVTHLEAPKRELRFMSVGIAKQCIVDVAPFGKCYEKQALEALWDSLHGHAVERTASTMVEIPKTSNVEESEVYIPKDSAGDENVDTKLKHGGVFDLTVKEVKDNAEGEKSSENGAEFVNCQKFSEVSEEAKVDEAENG